VKPLAERLRPKNFDEYVGQEHLSSPDSPFRKMIESGNLHSMILWGPPGVGKTTLVKIISAVNYRGFYSLSAINSGVKDLREVIEQSRKNALFNTKAPILFIDEIHRFSKSQQDSLLSAVEEGTVVLIGATTENPSFEVIPPLLSRCHVYILKHLEEKDLDVLIEKALKNDTELSKKNIKVIEKEALYRFSGGDARKLYNILEIICNSESGSEIIIDNKFVAEKLQEKITVYDKTGDYHYDIISAFIKSVRGSDPDASLYWLARMLDAGEDIKFIARRLIILAAEDIGLANPNALLLANACFDAVSKIGMPEARIILSETTIYLATSPKSNTAYIAIDKALDSVKESGNLPVPLHLRNAPTKLMKNIGYGADYKYPHNYEDNFTHQQYLPDKIKNLKFYQYGNNPKEQSTKKFWEAIRCKKR
jgi:putative ATPase